MRADPLKVEPETSRQGDELEGVIAGKSTIEK
jgi:hypothetical protein